METKVCKNFQACPIFNGILLDKTVTTNSYKKIYCEAGEQGWMKCKRYLVKEKTGKCPPDLLPNSIKPIEIIIASMEQ